MQGDSVSEASRQPTCSTPYVEDFDEGPGGWLGWGEQGGFLPEIRDSALVSRSPWWVDANHAPPGAGYLHLLAALHTHYRFVPAIARPHRFVEDGYSRDFTDARLTLRMRGEVDRRGAQLLLLVQADVPGTRTNFALTGQPIPIARDWQETTLTLAPDPDQCLCLGSHRDHTDLYGEGDIADVLRDVNCDIILVLFPLTIVPRTPVGDVDALRPYRDYEPDPRLLPSGDVWLDSIRLEYAPIGLS
jgi:hypothetical protein